MPRAAMQRPPTAEEVAAYAASIGYALDAARFCDYWAARGWEVRPRIRMKDWRAAVRNWRRQEAAWNAKAESPLRPDEAEINAHREAEASAVAKQVLPDMLYFVRLSKQTDAEGLERRQEALGRIRELSAFAARRPGIGLVRGRAFGAVLGSSRNMVARWNRTEGRQPPCNASGKRLSRSPRTDFRWDFCEMAAFGRARSPNGPPSTPIADVQGLVSSPVRFGLPHS